MISQVLQTFPSHSQPQRRLGISKHLYWDPLSLWPSKLVLYGPWLLRASLHIVASNVLSFEMYSEIGPAELLFPLPICKEQEGGIVLGFATTPLTFLQTRALMVVVVACKEYSIIQDGARENCASTSQPPSNLSTT
jgi:hypothetical protein